jgi:hypothetical protein
MTTIELVMVIALGFAVLALILIGVVLGIAVIAILITIIGAMLTWLWDWITAR